MLAIDELGLDAVDRNMLTAMIVKFGGRPVGLDTIAAATGEDASTIEDVYEPYLLRLGFIARTRAGGYCFRRGIRTWAMLRRRIQTGRLHSFERILRTFQLSCAVLSVRKRTETEIITEGYTMMSKNKGDGAAAHPTCAGNDALRAQLAAAGVEIETLKASLQNRRRTRQVQKRIERRTARFEQRQTPLGRFQAASGSNCERSYRSA